MPISDTSPPARHVHLQTESDSRREPVCHRRPPSASPPPMHTTAFLVAVTRATVELNSHRNPRSTTHCRPLDDELRINTHHITGWGGIPYILCTKSYYSTSHQSHYPRTASRKVVIPCTHCFHDIQRPRRSMGFLPGGRALGPLPPFWVFRS